MGRYGYYGQGYGCFNDCCGFGDWDDDYWGGYDGYNGYWGGYGYGCGQNLCGGCFDGCGYCNRGCGGYGYGYGRRYGWY